MDRFARLTDRQYHLFDYDGPPDAERVVVLMGSGAETVRETAAALGAKARRSASFRCGCTGRSPREAFLAALPQACRALAVIEQTKEPGATGEPLYLDVVTSLVRGGGGGHALDHAAGHRRPLRPVVEGLQSGDGQGGVRRAQEAQSQERLHRRHR